MYGYYGYGFGYINYYYLLFMLPGLILSLWAQFRVKSTYAKYDKVRTQLGLTGAQAARRILDMNGLYHVQIQQVRGNLTDHYDPRTNVVSLSDATFGNATVGAVGVAAHECGHAIQHAVGYAPIRIRSAIVPVANLGSSLGVPMVIFGIILNFTGLTYLGIGLFSLAVLFQLVTLPVELDASRRAVATLEGGGMLVDDEGKGVRRVLNAAAFTYIAALLTSILQLLYYVTLAGGRRRR